MLKGKNVFRCFFITMVLLLISTCVDLPDISAIAEAAGKLTPSYADAKLDQGIGLDAFDNKDTGLIVKFVKPVLTIFHPIIIILTAVAGLQIAFGISDGKKTVWNWILGAGLALSFADFALSNAMFGDFWNPPINPDGVTAGNVPKITIQNNTEANKDFLKNFWDYFKDDLIMNGAKAIKGICIKLLLLLYIINCSMKMALDLISGDKIKFLISETLKAGFYIFLISNWIDGIGLTGLLSHGFQDIGFIAGGNSSALELQPDNIWGNGLKLLNALWENCLQKVSVFHIIDSLLFLVAFVVACYCIFMISIEMLMARIEFYTMALLSMPLLSFAMIEYFAFLSQKAISAVFNLALKCCVLAFLQAMIVPFLTDMVEQVNGVNKDGVYFNSPGDSMMAWATLILGLILMLILVKQIPALVSGLLNGSPSLAGSSMTGMAMGVAGGAATAFGAVGKSWSGSKGDGGGSGSGGSSEGTKASDLENTTQKVGEVGAKAAMTVVTGGAAGGAVAAEEVAKETVKEGAEEVAKQTVKEGAEAATQGATPHEASPGNPDSGSGNTQGASQNDSGGTDTSSNDGKMPETGASQDGKAAEDAQQDAPDTTAQGTDGQADAPAEQSATPDGNGAATPPDTSTSTSSGSGSFSDNHPNIARAGRFAGNLAKAITMSTPAGDIINAYGKGSKLAEQFDESMGKAKPESPKEQLINLIIDDYSRRSSPPPQNPPPGGNNNNDNKF